MCQTNLPKDFEPVGGPIYLISGSIWGEKPAALSRKKFAYVGPVGNTAFLGRERRIHQDGRPYSGCPGAGRHHGSFGKKHRHIELLEVGEKSHMG